MADPQHRPSLSIIVTNWVLIDELRECLDALSASVHAPPFEVIVVLNGSSNQAVKLAKNHPVVDRTLELPANIGFGGGSNLGAVHARADHLVFLNDDTRVEPHWLAALAAASGRVPSPAIISSLVLGFDGLVQEAGSRVLSHGGTVQLGRGQTLDEARDNGLLTARPVDYGSGAALLVERAAFLSAGGFDVIFEPAYFEDVDLQLRLRERGHTVWFEPSAIVVHHSGRSTANEHWFRQFAANRSGHLFATRWASELASAPAIDDPIGILFDIPAKRRPVRPLTRALADSHNPSAALRIAHYFQDWLIDRLEDQESDIARERGPLAPGPSRRELLDHNFSMRERIAELERRGPLGIVKMRIGLALGDRGWYLHTPKRRSRPGWTSRDSA